MKYSASRLDIYQQSSYAMVKLLLDAGAEVNAQNDEKETPLHLGSKIIRYNLVKNIKNKKKKHSFQLLNMARLKHLYFYWHIKQILV